LRTAALPDLARAASLVAERGIALGKPIYLLDETTSTNDEAKRGAKGGEGHGATWVAESQTAGRGRQGRAWVSPRGENLLFSVLLRLTCPAARLPPIALVAGLAARDAIARASGADARIKWPNDVLVEGKKIAGVLVEAVLQGSRVEAVVVGVGLNVHTRDFPKEIAPRATSIALVTSSFDRVARSENAPSSRPVDRGEILADFLAALDRDVELVAARGLGLVHARLSSADALRGHFVTSENGSGTAEGIDVEGHLLVRNEEGILARWGAGEVHLANTKAY
jgi:BirA family transcriptional regulator, biotin operon repressor / biotin---[acetyl-CoA-carboxylase] ligase